MNNRGNASRTNTSLKVLPVTVDQFGVPHILVTFTDDGQRLTIAGASIGTYYEDFVFEKVLLGQFAKLADSKWQCYDLVHIDPSSGRRFSDRIRVCYFSMDDVRKACAINEKVTMVPLYSQIPATQMNPILQRLFAAGVVSIACIGNALKRM